MIRRLRLKFVAICMVLLTAVLGIVAFSFYVSAQNNIERTSMEVLQRVIRQDTFDLWPGQDPDQTQLPYFTVEVAPNNTAYVTGGTYNNLDNTAVLEKILLLCLQDGKTSGTIDSYNLRYLRQAGSYFQRIAFVDISMEKETLKDMMQSLLLISAVTMLVLLGISALLAWWATKPVEKALRQQKQFLSDASHELKTPLTVILSNAEFLDGAQLEERPARWADNIHSEAVRMKQLVEEMLTLARADNLPQHTVHSPQLLSDVVLDALLSFEPVVYESGKALEYRVAEDVIVEGDGDKLRRLVGILLDNAAKYADPGSTILVQLDKLERKSRLTVANRCPPIPPEQLSHLFERFYRADASRGEQSGFGLGLPIAASIAAEHKGSIRAESDADFTRFIVTLPLKK